MTSHGSKCPCSYPLKSQISTFVPTLNALSNAGRKKRKLLANASPCFVKFLSSCAGAVLRKDIELPASGYEQLKKHKKLLVYLNSKRNSLKRKKFAFLSKKGGFFAFIPILASLLAPLLGKLVADHI
jgi:hypothetical protein